jgi:hypothetical protein
MSLLGFQFENQPFILALIAVLTLFSARSEQRTAVNKEFRLYLAACAVALVVSAFVATSQDFVRLLLGPIVGWGLAREWERIKPSAFKTLLVIHAVLLCAGVLLTEPTVAVLRAIGLRGTTYYEGYNAYFYSEPSYASLNIMFIYVGLVIKTWTDRFSKQGRAWGVVAIVLLFATKSVTGSIFALLIFFVLIGSRLRIVIGGASIFFLSVALANPDVLPQRIALLLSAMSESVKGGDILIFSSLDPSSFYRMIANTVAVIGTMLKPLGYGTFLLNQSITTVEGSSYHLVALALTSSIVFADVDLQSANVAQSIPFAYLTFGGAIFFIYFARVFKELVQTRAFGNAKALLIIYMLTLFFWQSQLGFVLFWLLSFVILSNKKIRTYENA